MARKHRAVQQKGNLYTYYGFLSRFYSHISSCPPTGFPGHSDEAERLLQQCQRSSFKPERASQAIPTLSMICYIGPIATFQTRTGFPGHSDITLSTYLQEFLQERFKPERASQAIPTCFDSIESKLE